MREQVDVLVVGAGPAGSSAARAAAEGGARVLLVERRQQVGLPVQCAEYVPVQILGHASLPERCIAQRIRTLRTHLPDGTVIESPAAGYVLDRALFDKHLVATAWKAGARVWVATRALEPTERGALVVRAGRTIEVECRVIIGADGPHSTVGRWVGMVNAAQCDALQVEAPLPTPRECTEVYFHAAFAGGYGWLFPKGETANIGVGVRRSMGADPLQALEMLLARLEIRPDAVIGRTGGPVPCGGPVASLRVGKVLLAGDAAGLTHPVTGAGILTAVISGTLAGQVAARAVCAGELSALDRYEEECMSFVGGPLRHALSKRGALERAWSDDPVALSRAVRSAWVAFKSYGRRTEAENRGG